MSKITPKSSIEQQVEENLQRIYKAKADEPIPNRLLELLAQLQSQEGKHGKN